MLVNRRDVVLRYEGGEENYPPSHLSDESAVDVSESIYTEIIETRIHNLMSEPLNHTFEEACRIIELTIAISDLEISEKLLESNVLISSRLDDLIGRIG